MHSQIAFVPTMGALHEGHLSLVKKAKTLCDTVLVSIFVNPSQFGPNEDLTKYPRTLNEDVELLKPFADAVFLPTEAEMVSDFDQFRLYPSDLGSSFEGRYRPGHFEGVCKIVLKLLAICQPKIVIFGEKDFQQFVILKRMVKVFGFPIQVLSSETIREETGLAMSSRNRYLSAKENEIATSIYDTLKATQTAVTNGNKSSENLIKDAKSHLDPSIKIDYLEIVDPETLTPISEVFKKSRVLFAGWVGHTRLIDNIEL